MKQQWWFKREWKTEYLMCAHTSAPNKYTIIAHVHVHTHTHIFDWTITNVILLAFNQLHYNAIRIYFLRWSKTKQSKTKWIKLQLYTRIACWRTELKNWSVGGKFYLHLQSKYIYLIGVLFLLFFSLVVCKDAFNSHRVGFPLLLLLIFRFYDFHSSWWCIGFGFWAHFNHLVYNVCLCADFSNRRNW